MAVSNASHELGKRLVPTNGQQFNDVPFIKRAKTNGVERCSTSCCCCYSKYASIIESQSRDTKCANESEIKM